MASSTKSTKAKMPDVRKMLAPITQDFATRDRINRAIMILNNHQLLMKYALTNDQSIPATRLYFEKVSAGMDPEPIIRNWFTIQN